MRQFLDLLDRDGLSDEAQAELIILIAEGY
jgi:hypothetical protein